MRLVIIFETIKKQIDISCNIFFYLFNINQRTIKIMFQLDFETNEENEKNEKKRAFREKIAIEKVLHF
jgi:hypothetical protein